MGRADQCTWHLSRPGPFFARPLRQGERPALAFTHAAARDSLRWAVLGTPVPDCLAPLGAVLATTPVRQAPAQEAHRLGQTGPDPVGALATAPADHRRG